MTEHATEVDHNDNAVRRHEPDAVWAGTVASIGIGLLLLVILGLIGIAIAFKILIPSQPLVGAGDEWIRQHQAPGVQPNQAYERERLLADEESFLQQYAWQDKDRGVARIPIERGIEIMARRNMTVEWPGDDQADSGRKEAK